MEDIRFHLSAGHEGQKVTYETSLEGVATWYELMDKAILPALRAHTFILATNEELIGALEDVTKLFPVDLSEELAEKDALIERILIASFKYEWPNDGVTFSQYKADILRGSKYD